MGKFDSNLTKKCVLQIKRVFTIFETNFLLGKSKRKKRKKKEKIFTIILWSLFSEQKDLCFSKIGFRCFFDLISRQKSFFHQKKFTLSWEKITKFYRRILNHQTTSNITMSSETLLKVAALLYGNPNIFQVRTNFRWHSLELARVAR